MHMRDATECINSIGCALFAVIKAALLMAEKFNAVPQIIKRTEQCKVEMQSTWLKLKLFD